MPCSYTNRLYNPWQAEDWWKQEHTSVCWKCQSSYRSFTLEGSNQNTAVTSPLQAGCHQALHLGSASLQGHQQRVWNKTCGIWGVCQQPPRAGGHCGFTGPPWNRCRNARLLGTAGAQLADVLLPASNLLSVPPQSLLYSALYRRP